MPYAQHVLSSLNLCNHTLCCSPIMFSDIICREFLTLLDLVTIKASKVALVVKNLPTSARDIRDMDLIPESGNSSGVELINPHWYFCLENSIGPGAWQAIVHGATKSRTGLSTKHVIQLVRKFCSLQVRVSVLNLPLKVKVNNLIWGGCFLPSHYPYSFPLNINNGLA